MSKLSINAKLALPGLVLLARDVFFDSIKDEELLSYYLQDTLKAFTRFEISTVALRKLIEELYAGYDVEVESARKEIAAFIKLLAYDSEVHITIVELMKSANAALAGDEKAYNNLQDKVSLLNNSKLLSYFPINIDTSKQVSYKDKAALLATEDLKALKEAKDPKYKSYLSAKKNIKLVVTDYVKAICRQAGGPVDYEAMLALLQEHKLEHTLPTGFVGFIDEFCQLYTVNRKKLASVPHGCSIIMNKSYDAKLDNTYVCTAKSPLAKASMYVYTADYKQSSKNNKFKVVKVLAKSINKLRKDWLALLKPANKNFEAAMILELVYQTQARIGDDKNATLDKRTNEYKKTFGISTILGKHLFVDGDTITIEYPGKAAFKGDTIHLQKHIYKADKETKIIYEFLSAKANKPDNKVFSISAQKVRDLLVELNAPEGTTIHKLRTLKGTLMMQEKIKNHPFKDGKASVTAVNKWLKEEALEVGIRLGHMSGEKYTASTAIAHYIDPATMLKLYKEAKVIAPKTMLKLVGIDVLSLEEVS